MNSRIVLLMFAAFFASIAGSASAFGTLGSFYNYLPPIGIAIVLGFLIAGTYYMIGSVMNNAKAKATGLSEIGQAVGTAIIVVIILAFFNVYGSLTTYLVPPNTLSSLCGSWILNSQLQFLSGSPSDTICISGTGLNPSLSGVTYGLGATYVIIASLLSQDVNNINAMYTFVYYIQFAAKFQPTLGVCANAGCAFGVVGEEEPEEGQIFRISISDVPLSGYSALDNFYRPVMAEAFLSFYSFFTQLIVVLIMLYVWPYLLAAGILLRATFFGRRVGGLLMAIAFGVIVFFPFVVSIEYNTLSCVGSAGCPVLPIGTESFPNPANNPLYSSVGGSSVPAPTGINFFNFPNLQTIFDEGNNNGLQGCWPPLNNMPTLELALGALYVSPTAFGAGIYSLLASFGSFLSSQPSLPGVCGPQTAMPLLLESINAYGIIMISAYILPLMNVLLAISAVKGLSALFGGDTDIAGIGKLV